jgi:hypothetical protein
MGYESADWIHLSQKSKSRVYMGVNFNKVLQVAGNFLIALSTISF